MCLMLTFDNNYLLNVFQIKLVPLYIYVSRDTCDLNNFERFKVTINILDVYAYSTLNHKAKRLISFHE